jgi:transposase
MVKKYHVHLTESERWTLRRLISVGKGAARRLVHARILLAADQGLADDAIMAAVLVGRATVERVRRRFVEEGLDAALDPRRPERLHLRKLDGAQEARLIALACGPAPDGRDRWSLRLLADRLVELEIVEAISYETVRQTLKKTR